MRLAASDPEVFSEVFVAGDYSAAIALDNVRYVVDCGANVGYSSVQFLERFPDANVIAVEPDLNNARICSMNLRPFGDRARVINAGVWHRRAPLVVERGAFRDGREWSFQVREAIANEVADVQALDIGSIMEQQGIPHIDLLKIDIEGSERHLFGGDVAWLHRVRNMLIELHDPEDSLAFATAMEAFSYTHVRNGPVLFCGNIRAKSAR